MRTSIFVAVNAINGRRKNRVHTHTQTSGHQSVSLNRKAMAAHKCDVFIIIALKCRIKNNKWWMF